MLLGNKKKQEEEQNWCIVLTPLRNEIDKKKVARKISEVFYLSLEEALDLVSNTPIILLDNLSRTLAAEVKDYFRNEGAELVLTNDIFYKRKCYRTVWPETPNLSFLNQWNEAKSKPGSVSGQALAAEEALQELRSLQPRKNPSRQSSDSAKESSDEYAAKEKKQLLDELEMWRKECSLRRGEVEKLQASLSKLKDVSTSGDRGLSGQDGKLAEKDKLVRDQQALIKNLQEKYEALREEYRQARSFFEDKVSASTRDSQDSKGKLKSLEDKARALHEKNQILEASLEKVTAELRGLQVRDSEDHKDKDARLQSALASVEAEKRKSASMEAEIASLREREASLSRAVEEQKKAQASLGTVAAEAQRVHGAYKELQDQLQNHVEKTAHLEIRLQEESQRHKAYETAVQKNLTETRERRDLFEIRLLDAEKELQSSTRRINELTDALKKATESKNALSAELEERKNLEELGRQQNESVIRKYNAMIVQYDNDKLQLIKSEQRVKDLEEEFKRSMVSSEENLRKALTAENYARELEASFRASQSNLEDLRRSAADAAEELAEKNRLLEVAALERESLKRAFQEHSQRADNAEAKNAETAALNRKLEEAIARAEQLLQDRTKQAESKDREIEALRRQIKDINFQMEQRETLLKRNQIMAQLAEKEDKLKRLVDDQGRVEAEIRQREEMMRQILSYQEALEKEIVEGKQAQRHLLEQVKKEKPGQGRSAKTEIPSSIPALASKKDVPAHD